MAEDDERYTKRDRAARLTRVATLLYQHRPYGLTAREIARRIDVNARTAMTRRLVAPAYLEPNAWGRGCYLIADDDLTHQRRTFKLERIKEAELTTEPFEPSGAVDAPAYLARSWTVSDEAPAVVRV